MKPPLIISEQINIIHTGFVCFTLRINRNQKIDSRFFFKQLAFNSISFHKQLETKQKTTNKAQFLHHHDRVDSRTAKMGACDFCLVALNGIALHYRLLLALDAAVQRTCTTPPRGFPASKIEVRRSLRSI